MRDTKELRAEAVFQRYWRGFRLFRALRWVGCLACIVWLVPHILYGDSMVTAVLAFLLYLGYLYVLRLANSIRFLSLNLILNRDCDPVKFTEVSRLLKERLGSRTSGMAGLNVAWGLYWSGRFAEAETALADVDLKGKNPQGRLLLRNLDFNCRMELGDLAGARHVRQETEAYLQSEKPRSAARKTGERLLDIMDAAFAREAKDWEEFRRLYDHMTPGNTTEFQQVTVAYALAKADLAQGETENARARLTYVTEHGGTLYIAGEARRLLAELEQT